MELFVAPGTNHTNRGIEDFGGSDDGCFFSFIWKTWRILEYMGISRKKKETEYKMFHRESCWYWYSTSGIRTYIFQTCHGISRFRVFLSDVLDAVCRRLKKEFN